MRTISQTLLVLLLSAGAAGCETFAPHQCDPSAAGNPAITYTGGETQGCVYTSSSPPDGGTSPWQGELLYFPGGMHYALQQKPGCTAQWVQAYLSFDRYGTLEGGTLAQAAGNQVEVNAIDVVPDGGDGTSTAIVVANDSCVDYWLLVVAGVQQTASCNCQ